MNQTPIPQAYITGPYSAEDPHQLRRNIMDAMEGAELAIGLGWLPILPHTMGPHHGTTWDEAMLRCRRLIRALKPGRDILVVLPTWAESRGAREEIGLAISLGVEVVPLDELRPVTEITTV